MTAPTPPGWYPDPTGIPRQVFWDGQQWHIPPPPPPPSKTRRWALPGVIVGAVLLVVILGSLADMGNDKGNSPGSSVAAGAPAVMNSTVSDGKFSFRVTGVDRSRQGSILSQPKGEYVVVTMSVTNSGDEAQTFFANNQKLVDTQGREYDADSMAAAGDAGWMEEMNPGFTITAKVPFDVPPGTQVDRIVLHDSAFSGGATVKLVE
jgi:hypothetical protein